MKIFLIISALICLDHSHTYGPDCMPGFEVMEMSNLKQCEKIRLRTLNGAQSPPEYCKTLSPIGQGDSFHGKYTESMAPCIDYYTGNTVINAYCAREMK